MDIKEKIEQAAKKLMSDKTLMAKFEKNPVSVIEQLIGIDLPDQQINQVIDGIKAKIKLDQVGDVLGGMTFGMPILFKVAIKPTPSIARQQQSISFSRMENTTLEVSGRHDPCIVPRAVPVVKAAAALAITDLLLDT